MLLLLLLPLCFRFLGLTLLGGSLWNRYNFSLRATANPEALNHDRLNDSQTIPVGNNRQRAAVAFRNIMAKIKRTNRKLPPIHPGEILREDYMKPLNLTAHRVAMALHVPATRIAEIVHERRGITSDTAIRLR